MKRVFYIAFILMVSCGSRTNKTTAEALPTCREYDSVRFSYIEPVENYHVTDVVSEYLNEWDYAPLELTFHNNKSHEEFTVRGGRLNWKSFLGIDSIQTEVVNLHYPEIAKNGIITAPYNIPFFFADIDFDGTKELITGNSVFAGTQREVGRFTAIYKIVDGRPRMLPMNFGRNRRFSTA